MAITDGSQSYVQTFDGEDITLYTYRPVGVVDPKILIVFHGSTRNAEGYRDSSIDLADEHGFIVVCPLFDETRWPSDAYQRANIVDGNDDLLPKAQWTTRYVPLIEAWAQAEIGGSPETYLYGFSAGGQFLSRVAAYDPLPGTKRYIIGSPSTHVMASTSEDIPYGFDHLGTNSFETAALKDYLALPLTIYLGEADNDPSDPALAVGSAAMRQGAHRLERGIYAYNIGKQVAAHNGWPFGWRLTTAPGVGHSNGAMMDAPEIAAALEDDPEATPQATKLGVVKTNNGLTYYLFLSTDGKFYLTRIDDVIDPPPPPETTLTVVTEPEITASEAVPDNEITYEATFSISTPAVFSWIDSNGVSQTGTPPGLYYRWEVGGVSESATSTLGAGTSSRIGKVIILYVGGFDPVTGEQVEAFSNALGPIVDTEAEPPVDDLTAPDDTDWGYEDSFYDPATFTPTADSTFRPRIRYNEPIQEMQWSTSGSTPALEQHWETCEKLSDGTGYTVWTTSILHPEAAGYDVYTENKSGLRDVFRIRVRRVVGGGWSAESSKKTVPVPPPLTKPSAVTNWTLTAGTTDGRINIAITSGQPSSWGSGTAGVLQWHNVAQGWQNVPSLSFSPTLPSSLHGTQATIQVRAVSSEGIEGPANSKTVQVPGSTVAFPEIHKPMLLIGEAAKGKGMTNGFREGKGGEHYQCFHGGSVCKANPDVSYHVMDVTPGWLCMNTTAEFPTILHPEMDGILSGWGISCVADPEFPNRAIYLMASRGPNSNNNGGLFTTEDYAKTFPYKYTTDETGYYFRGGQAQEGDGNTTPYRAWHRTIIFNNQNTEEVLCISRRLQGGGAGHILKSTNRGKNWTRVGGVSQQDIYTVTQDAGGRVYYGSEAGIHMSMTFGAGFGSAFRPTNLPNKPVIGIECHPTNNQIAYIAVYDGGCYRTTDRFETVKQIGPTPAGGFCNVFASPWNFNNVWFMGMENPANPERHSVFSSNGLNENPNFTEVPNMEPKTYGWDLQEGGGDRKPRAMNGGNRKMHNGVLPVYHPASNHKAALAHFKARHWSTRDGINFANAADGSEHAGGGDLNWHALLFSKHNPDVASLLAFDKGAMRTSDGYQSWTKQNRNQAMTGSYAPNRPNDDWMVCVSGSYAGAPIFWTKNAHAASPSWTAAGVGDKRQFASFAQGNDGNSRIYTSTHRCTNFDQASPTFSTYPTGGGFPSGGQVVMVSHKNSLVLYALASNMRNLHKSTDGGTNWSPYVDFGRSMAPSSYIEGFYLDPKDDAIVYWWNNGLKKYNGVSTTNITNGMDLSYVNRIRVDPFEDVVYFSSSKMNVGQAHLYRVINAGTQSTRQTAMISRHLPRSRAWRSMDVCPHTGILYTLGTVGTRYFPPVTKNALCVERLNYFKTKFNYDTSAIYPVM